MDYSNGKIYCIRNYITDDVYVGSSCQSLCKRLSWHKSSINKKTKQNFPLYIKMRELDKINFYIELLENYPCTNKEELRAREGHYIREMGTLNKYIAGRTPEERQPQKNERTKQDRLNNPEKYRAKDKEKYEKHKEKIKDKARENYYKNKDDTNNRRALNITTCECGTTCRKDALKQHERSNKHQEYLKTLEQEN